MRDIPVDWHIIYLRLKQNNKGNKNDKSNNKKGNSKVNN